MAWTDLTFAFGSLLTSTKMTQLDNNFDALASGASGAPEILIDALTACTSGHYQVAYEDTGLIAGDTYTCYNTFKIGRGGTVVTRLGLIAAEENDDVYGRVYVNSVAVGTERTTSTSISYTYWTESFSIAAGDIVQIFGKANAGEAGYGNFAIACGNPVEAAELQTDW